MPKQLTKDSLIAISLALTLKALKARKNGNQEQEAEYTQLAQTYSKRVTNSPS